jgi:hypothetical protein
MNNVAVGFQAALCTTTGIEQYGCWFSGSQQKHHASNNTAVGSTALACNTTGTSVTSFGLAALCANTTGVNNTAVGVEALRLNTTGLANLAIGLAALCANVEGDQSDSSWQRSFEEPKPRRQRRHEQHGCWLSGCAVYDDGDVAILRYSALVRLRLNTTGCRATLRNRLTFTLVLQHNGRYILLAVGQSALRSQNTTGLMTIRRTWSQCPSLVIPQAFPILQLER